MSKTEKMELNIVIDGDSADELFAVGPIDLRDFFLPEKLGVKSSDVKSINFHKIIERDENGNPSKYTVYKDNFLREEEKTA